MASGYKDCLVASGWVENDLVSSGYKDGLVTSGWVEKDLYSV